MQERRAGSSRDLHQLRQLVESPLDYLFYAACRSDQTAADATIGGTPHGAFTYYLTRDLSSLGVSGDRSDLDHRVENDLVSYTQVPQLESRVLTGPFFLATDTTSQGGGDSSITATPLAGDRLYLGTFPTEALRSLRARPSASRRAGPAGRARPGSRIRNSGPAGREREGAGNCPRHR